jgi:hypothetical protein|tara:strand:- start:1252 stop:1761 length:510 start_codon:yes stop_codon:yes gene_type:complete
MSKKLWLILGGILIVIGILKPDLSNFNIRLPVNQPSCNLENYVIDAPSDTELLEKARAVSKILKQSDDSTRKSDSLKLSALYSDIATLIEIDGDDKIISDTASIREVNSLSGKMLRLDVKNKYQGLADKAKDLLISAIGEEDVVLDDETRNKAVDAFRALSWAFYQGSQ